MRRLAVFVQAMSHLNHAGFADSNFGLTTEIIPRDRRAAACGREWVLAKGKVGS